MKKIILLTFISLGLFYGCKDDDQDTNALPEATQVGKNTGGAMVDGKVWVSKIENPDLNPGGNNTHYEFVNGEYNLQIVLRELNNSNNRIVLNLSRTNNLLTENYQLTSARFEYQSQIYDVNFGNSDGNLTITKIDIQNRIISGKFSFKAGNINGNATKVIISDGRFDKKYL